MKSNCRGSFARMLARANRSFVYPTPSCAAATRRVSFFFLPFLAGYSRALVCSQRVSQFHIRRCGSWHPRREKERPPLCLRVGRAPCAIRHNNNAVQIVQCAPALGGTMRSHARAPQCKRVLVALPLCVLSSLAGRKGPACCPQTASLPTKWRCLVPLLFAHVAKLARVFSTGILRGPLEHLSVLFFWMVVSLHPLLPVAHGEGVEIAGCVVDT